MTTPDLHEASSSAVLPSAAERSEAPPTVGTVGEMMEPAYGVFPPDATVRETIERIRELVKTRLVTYAFVAEDGDRLQGVIAMRDLLLAEPEQLLSSIMLRDPFTLQQDMPLLEAMRQAVGWHLPVYPVCDRAGRLVGLVRGSAMFERQAIEISAQAGKMVGVQAGERVDTPLWECWRRRHPWLQANLLTAFVAGAVVAVFQSTIDQLALLAVFLPILAGQCGNTGSQSLAITLRGLTLGELRTGEERRMAGKETLLGLANGAMVGVTAAFAMYLFASYQGETQAPLLALVVFLALTFSCVVSGVTGVLVPLALRRLGTDPATASAIVLSTATDVVSMALLLGLATWMVL